MNFLHYLFLRIYPLDIVDYIHVMQLMLLLKLIIQVNFLLKVFYHRGRERRDAVVKINYNFFYLVPPRWISEPKDTALMLGNGMSIACQAEGYPTPTITWFKAQGKFKIFFFMYRYTLNFFFFLYTVKYFCVFFFFR